MGFRQNRRFSEGNNQTELSSWYPSNHVQHGGGSLGDARSAIEATSHFLHHVWIPLFHVCLVHEHMKFINTLKCNAPTPGRSGNTRNLCFWKGRDHDGPCISRGEETCATQHSTLHPRISMRSTTGTAFRVEPPRTSNSRVHDRTPKDKKSTVDQRIDTDFGHVCKP